ncbi:alanine--tRNA ligase [Natranaerofaba carboxydovora]|uniref:alanine--tRNA ligase n=1 Tax=Natranaerofaba carboxydovora TaxID=2742683 RepID=UPI001F144529|nr:alanine--tRNA ligase [Natranaerofaba carboxydovora]UMZ74008.1 Alanine--tRNA ligase [Natranaerofaba carboxydovora]
MKTDEIRKKFLEFFEERDHMVLPSFSLIPEDDPGLLLIGAGMAPLKPYFTGEKTPPKTRMATCQKCIRTPDIEEVGKTARHATFFEMLGNFSFGDYFKKESIAWGYEFVTKVLKLPEEKVWVSVYYEDDEAYNIWKDDIGIPEEKIVKLGKEDNFWEIGEGPCGPCSEIYYDRGEKYGCGGSECKPGCDCDRFFELWNHVFTQFNRDSEGNYTTLDQKNIDTGAGLERLAVILQDVSSIYEIDSIKPILDFVCKTSNKEYGKNEKDDVSMRIITEHIRSVTFMVGDGVLPSNEGRGYVLRRILRRAARHAKLLGIEGTFMPEASNVVIDIMEDAYPELKEREEYINKIIQIEEERFLETVEQGMEILKGYIEDLNNEGKDVLDGSLAFKLYDTYGFPIDLTREILIEQGLKVDEDRFTECLEEQRERARKAQAASSNMIQNLGEIKDLEKISSKFVGYEVLECEALIKGIIKENKLVDKVEKGEDAQILLDATPFYAESGGQVGDQGEIQKEDAKAVVEDTYYSPFEQPVHQIRIEEGSLQVGDKINSKVYRKRRESIKKNHSSTHLLHHALRSTLGAHVEQAGSLVAPDRLRFDFTHFEAITKEELEDIEKQVNAFIWENYPVNVTVTHYNKAKEMGAVSLFGEKYEDEVRVVEMGESMELCGGTHVDSTGEVGLFKIIGESGIGAGLRRIEAITGEKAFRYLNDSWEKVKDISSLLKTNEENVVVKVEEVLNDLKEKDKELEKFKEEIRKNEVDEILDKVTKIDGVSVLTHKVDDGDPESMRRIGDQIKNKLSSGVVVLGSSDNEKVQFISMVTKDLTDRGIHAGDIVKKVAEVTGGGGGGRPTMAQAGGKNPGKLNEALGIVPDLIKEKIQ